MYQAIVAKIKTKPHPNADRIQLGDVLGFQVVVGLDVKDGDLGVFFPTDGQLSDEFCLENDLYPRFADGKKVGGGFIDPKNRRVRAQSFRGEKSYGFWTPVSYFNYTGVELKEGQTFTELNKHPICNKYETEHTIKNRRNKSRSADRRETPMFRMHVDTEQLKYKIDEIPVGALVTITGKMHGTSGRYGRVLVPHKYSNLPIVGKLFKPTWSYLLGSRRVIVDDSSTGFYGTNEFRHNSVAGVVLKKGETIYYELVGFVNKDQPIMSPCSHSTVKAKSLKTELEKYPDPMVFDYGQVNGTCGLYVYRITMSNEDGELEDLPWVRVRERANELGFRTPIELDSFIYDGNKEKLLERVDELTDGDDWYGNHIREGVVVRVDTNKGTKFYKNKSFLFYVLEGVIKDSGLEDLEESS